jgi:hypothetical protein
MQISFKKGPYLFPWYFDKKTPMLLWNSHPLFWKYIESVGDTNRGLTTLTTSNGQLMGFVDTYTYLLPSRDGESFAIWKRNSDIVKTKNAISIYIYRTEQLKEMSGDRLATYQHSVKRSLSWCFDVEPESSFQIRLVTTRGSEDLKKFLSGFDTFCMVEEIPNLYAENSIEAWWKTAIAVVMPEKGTLQVLPQDWFNKSNCDFGYQWITWAEVDEVTGKIRGGGFRISDFVLESVNILKSAST